MGFLWIGIDRDGSGGQPNFKEKLTKSPNTSIQHSTWKMNFFSCAREQNV